MLPTAATFGLWQIRRSHPEAEACLFDDGRPFVGNGTACSHTQMGKLSRLPAALLCWCAVTAVYAQDTPVGLWKTIDDHTGQEKSLVRITDSGGVISGRVEKLLHPSKPNPLCEQCRDARRGKFITGLTIVEGLRQHGEVWDGGKILDPENGRIYTVRMKPMAGGSRLEVRGYLGPFFRTQTWSRVE
jgi:uncharacterized protein (DUF2147 family)